MSRLEKYQFFFATFFDDKTSCFIQFNFQNQPRENVGGGQNSGNNHTTELCAATGSGSQNQFRN